MREFLILYAWHFVIFAVAYVLGAWIGATSRERRLSHELADLAEVAASRNVRLRSIDPSAIVAHARREGYVNGLRDAAGYLGDDRFMHHEKEGAENA